MRRTSALIVGGGPAGAVAALGLARAGLSPLVLERDRETRDALCGGFLSWATLARLEKLGVDVPALGAHRVEKLALFTGRHATETRLPAPAAALSRRVLDRALLDAAERAGAGVERGTGVRARDGDGLRTEDGATLDAGCVVLATGKHELRGAARPRPRGDSAVGLRWRLGGAALARLIGDKIELHLFRGGYAGLVVQEDGSANLCLAARRSLLAEAGGRPDRLLAAIVAESPALAARLDCASSVGMAQAIANVPYGWRATEGEPGLYRIGDQAGVIPSLAGEGIAIAIASGTAAADAIAGHVPAERFQADFARRLRRPVPVAGLLWRTAEHPAGAHAMLCATRTAPWLAGLAARLTRVA